MKLHRTNRKAAGEHENFPVFSRSVPASSSVLTKRFIRGFNFEKPSWDNLPVSFPNLPKDGLTKEEGHLLDAIKLAWISTNKKGRKKLIKDMTRVISVFIAILLVGALGLRILGNLDNLYINSVNAATVKIDEVIQSTMSAILRK